MYQIVGYRESLHILQYTQHLMRAHQRQQQIAESHVTPEPKGAVPVHSSQQYHMGFVISAYRPHTTSCLWIHAGYTSNRDQILMGGGGEAQQSILPAWCRCALGAWSSAGAGGGLSQHTVRQTGIWGQDHMEAH